MTIMLLSVDRYVAVRHPVKSRQFSSAGVVIATALCATWLVAGVVMAPLAAMRSVDQIRLPSGDQLDFCHEVRLPPRKHRCRRGTARRSVSVPILLNAAHLGPSQPVASLPALGPWAPPAERGPSLESIFRVSVTVDLCECNKIISLKKLFHHSQLGAPQKEKKSGGPGHVPSVPIGQDGPAPNLMGWIRVRWNHQGQPHLRIK